MAAVALTAALVLSFHAHTHSELADWQTGWQDRAADTLTVELMDEWRDWHDRHQWFFDPREISGPARDSDSAPTYKAPSYDPGVEQWRPLVAFFWPAEHVDRMLSIMACESGGDPNVPNRQGSGALGLFQIMPGWQKTWPGDYTDPWTNAAVAYQIWLVQGYSAWVCKA